MPGDKIFLKDETVYVNGYKSKYILPSNIAKTQSFEGEITFIKETSKDTSVYTYKVKNNIIRIDELNKKLELINYMLVDIKKEEIYF